MSATVGPFDASGFREAEFMPGNAWFTCMI